MLPFVDKLRSFSIYCTFVFFLGQLYFRCRKSYNRILFSVYIATFEIFSRIDNSKMQNILGSSKTDRFPCLEKDDRLNLLEPVDFQTERCVALPSHNGLFRATTIINRLFIAVYFTPLILVWKWPDVFCILL